MMEKEQIDTIKWKLTELSCADADCIDSNDYEIVGEDEQGRDGYCTVQINTIADEALSLVKHLEDLHSELIMAVARKWPDETRHETALKYIRQAEESDCVATGAKQA